MGKLRKMLNALIPEYSLIPLIAAVTVNMGVYGGARMIAGDWLHHNIECGLDRMIPFIPYTVVIYLGCYLFWIVNYILIARQGKLEHKKMLAKEILGIK